MHLAARSNSRGSSGSSLLAKYFTTANCFFDNLSSAIFSFTPGASDNSVIIRVPADDRTPAGNTASNTCPNGHR